MQIRNLDFECYKDALKKQENHQENWLQTGYTPRGYYLKDFCIICVNGDFHLFHIAGTPGVSCCLPGNEIWFGHAVTQNFLSWRTMEPCFYIQPGEWDEGHIFAPYVLEKEGDVAAVIASSGVIPILTSSSISCWSRTRALPLPAPRSTSGRWQ